MFEFCCFLNWFSRFLNCRCFPKCLQLANRRKNYSAVSLLRVSFRQIYCSTDRGPACLWLSLAFLAVWSEDDPQDTVHVRAYAQLFSPSGPASRINVWAHFRRKRLLPNGCEAWWWLPERQRRRRGRQPRPEMPRAVPSGAEVLGSYRKSSRLCSLQRTASSFSASVSIWPSQDQFGNPAGFNVSGQGSPASCCVSFLWHEYLDSKLGSLSSAGGKGGR